MIRQAQCVRDCLGKFGQGKGIGRIKSAFGGAGLLAIAALRCISQCALSASQALEALLLGLRWVSRRTDSGLSHAAADVESKIRAVLEHKRVEQIGRAHV